MDSKLICIFKCGSSIFPSTISPVPFSQSNIRIFPYGSLPINSIHYCESPAPKKKWPLALWSRKTHLRTRSSAFVPSHFPPPPAQLHLVPVPHSTRMVIGRWLARAFRLRPRRPPPRPGAQNRRCQQIRRDGLPICRWAVSFSFKFIQIQNSNPFRSLECPWVRVYDNVTYIVAAIGLRDGPDGREVLLMQEAKEKCRGKW